MKRDGNNISLWQNTVEDYYPPISAKGNEVYDVVIVGGGITGVTTALQLQKQGKSCILLEAHTLCFGTSGGTTAHLNTFFDTSYDQIQKNFGESDAQLVARAARQALELYESNCKQYKIDCDHEVKDGYLFSLDKKQTEELRSIHIASVMAGTDVEYIDNIPVPIEFDKAVVYHGQGQIHPIRYVIGLAKEFEKAGGVIVENCRLNKFSGKEILEIETDSGVIKSHFLFFGTHIPPGINLLHFRCAPYRSYAMAVVLEDGNYPEGLAYDMYDPYHYYRTQEVDGKKYLIAGGEDHKTGHVENTEACFLKLEAHIRKYFEVKEIAYKWSSQYFEPSDGLAYIGHLPGNPSNVFVATGFGGNGMTYSHIAANIITGLIVKGENEFAELFDPNRIKMVAGFSNFVKENADVVSQFIGRRISQEKLIELADLASGEAKVVKFEGESIALYKGENGDIHAIDPVCSHAKCMISWNTSERTWDCPCHGARYSIDGEVLTGPAQKALEVVNIHSLIESDKVSG